MTLTPADHTGATPPPPSKISALLLDDSDFDRRRIQRMTDGLGLDIVLDSVPSIAALEAMLERQSFDLIMLDFRLPEGDGFDALEVVRANLRNRDAATVMITADARTDVAVAAVKGGCMDFIAKSSMDGDLLREVMVAALDHNRQRLAAARGAMPHPRQLEESLARALSQELSRGALRHEMSAALQEAARGMIRANAGLDAPDSIADILGYWDTAEFQFRN